MAAKNALDGQLERRAVFFFYSESGLGEEAIAALAEAGVLVLDSAKLASYEASLEALSSTDPEERGHRLRGDPEFEAIVAPVREKIGEPPPEGRKPR
ncbi:MAG: hypothetical protein GY769_05765 [bacterium]|nr:hypothetical protein [bacterium]